MMIKKWKKSLRSPKPRPKNRPPTLRFKKRKSLRSTSKFRPARTKYCVIWGHSLKSRYGCDQKLPHFGKKWGLRVPGPIIMPYLSIISCHFWKIFFRFFQKWKKLPLERKIEFLMIQQKIFNDDELSKTSKNELFQEPLKIAIFGHFSRFPRNPKNWWFLWFLWFLNVL